MVPPPSKAGRKKKQIDTYTNTTLTGTPTTKTIKYNYGNDGKTGWNYLLTSYDADSDNVVDTNEKISYDAIGNPTTYRGATIAWYGRQLKSFTKNGITSTMTYDADGLRSTKTVAGSKTEYQYVGDKLFYEKRGDGNSFYYFYDSYGKLSAIYHYVNGTRVPYHVVTNAQGDVVALYNWSGTKVAEYSYDAWGNCSILSDSTSTKIATLNPFRYRSYYFDRDLGLYYLQSRYYDAEIGRFINADGYVTTGQGVTSYNMFAHCLNNPVMYSDPSGYAGKYLLEAILGAIETLIYEMLPEGDLKNRLGKYRKAKEIHNAVSTILDANEEANVLPQKEMETYTRDVHNLRYYTSIGQSYEVSPSPNTEIYGSDEAYSLRCETFAGRYSDVAEGYFININIPWEKLSETDQEILSNSVSQWDSSVGLCEKVNHGFRGGLSFELE